MGLIARDYFLHSPLLIMPVIALVLFLLAFLMVCVRALSTRKAALDHAAHLPLQDGEPAGNGVGHE